MAFGTVMPLFSTALGHATPPGARPAPPSDGTSQLKILEQTTTFGTLGFVDGQTVRLSAVRAGNDDAKVCHVDLNFFDVQGNRQGAGVSADLLPGHAVFLDLERGEVQPPPTAPRAQIYAVVDVESEPAGTGNPKDDKPACDVAMSIEIVDADGRTQIYQGAFTANVKVGAKKACCCICCSVSTTGECTRSICACLDGVEAPPCPTCPRS